MRISDWSSDVCSSDLIKRRRDVLEGMGVEFRLNIEIGKDIEFDTLLKDYDAVFLGMGTYTYMKGDFPGENVPGVHEALPVHVANINRVLARGKDDDMELAVKNQRVVVHGGRAEEIRGGKEKRQHG